MRSIRTKFFVILSSIVAGMILLLFLANNFLLQDYYINRKKAEIEKFYSDINQLDPSEYNRTTSLFTTIELTANVNIQIYDTSNNLVYSSRQVVDPMPPGFIPGTDPSVQYILQIVSVPGVPGDSLTLRGLLDNGYFIELHSPISAIQDNVSYFNTFFIYLGLLGIGISLIVSYLIANRFTKPIRKINRVAKQIKNLDFSYLADNHNKDEIGELADSINSMSETLSKTFSNLQEELEENKTLSQKRIELVNSVSHELKTPLALIQGYTEGLLLHIDQDSDKKDYYANVIIEEVQNMNTIIEHLLEIEDVSSNTKEVHFETIEYTDFLSKKINKHKLQIKERELSLEEDYGEEVMVQIDPYLVDRLITNYIVNAIHYCEVPGVINITVERLEHTLRTKVFNSYRKLTEEEQSSIWESFTKIDRARTRDVGGHGLGLTIVKSIQEKLGQEYGVRNVEGGVEFYFDIPLAETKDVK